MSQHKDAPAAADELRPYVADEKRLPEFTVQAVVLGFILSIVFNAANAYLGLKIGLTVAAGIPSAIISMGVFRVILPKLLGRSGTILENNIVHTIASTGEALAAAVIFTVPALFFLGRTEIANSEVFLLGAAGGVLGLLMMIPLRHSLVVGEHKNLPYPEGRACAQVLIAGDKGGASAAPVFFGILTGGVFKFAMSGLALFKDVMSWSSPRLHQAGFGYEVSPLLVGVGYLVGLRIALVMLAGGLLGYWVLIPLIHAMGGMNVVAPGDVPIGEMSTGAIRATYVRYIGAGGVAFGGLISLLKSLPDIAGSVKHGAAAIAKSRAGRAAAGPAQADPESRSAVFAGAFFGLVIGAFAWEAPWRMGPEAWPGALRLAAGALAHFLLAGALGAAVGAVLLFLTSRTAAAENRGRPRVESDLPLSLVGAGTAAMFALLWLHPAFGLSFPEAAIVLLFSFFFVAVSARMVGLIGSTNQPVSGMTITALLAMTLIFVALGHDPATVKTTAIMAGAVVCIAISLSGDLSQDLKTAALVGATPWKVQTAEVLGTLISAVRTGFILLLLYKAYGFGAPTPEHPNPLEAPQSQLMASLVEGATGGNLPWTLLLTGAGIGLVAELCGVSALALSIGLYLPLTNWPMIALGGLLAWAAARKHGGQTREDDPGSLFSSGLIAGDALTGIALALVTVGGFDQALRLRALPEGSPLGETLLSTGLYALVAAFLWRYASKGAKKHA